MTNEALSGFWNHPAELKNLWNIPEYMVLFYIHSSFLNIQELSLKVTISLNSIRASL